MRFISVNPTAVSQLGTQTNVQQHADFPLLFSSALQVVKCNRFHLSGEDECKRVSWFIEAPSTCPAASDTQHGLLPLFLDCHANTPGVHYPTGIFLSRSTLRTLSKRSAREKCTRLESVRLSSASQRFGSA